MSKQAGWAAGTAEVIAWTRECQERIEREVPLALALVPLALVVVVLVVIVVVVVVAVVVVSRSKYYLSSK